jgi:hypothetical protein
MYRTLHTLLNTYYIHYSDTLDTRSLRFDIPHGPWCCIKLSFRFLLRQNVRHIYQQTRQQLEEKYGRLLA